MSLRRLGLERIDLFQLHRIDPKVPLEDQIGELAELQDEGKIGAIGLSEVSVERDRRGAQDHRDRDRPEPLQPDRPQVRGRPRLLRPREHRLHPVVPDRGRQADAERAARSTRSSKDTGATPAQVALAWLLARAQIVLPIPGTSTSRTSRRTSARRRCC